MISADIIEEIRDVYLDEFADTDDEHDDEEAEEREIRREEKRKVRRRQNTMLIGSRKGNPKQSTTHLRVNLNRKRKRRNKIL